MDIELRAYKVEERKSINSDKQIFCQDIEIVKIYGTEGFNINQLKHVELDTIMKYLKEKFSDELYDYIVENYDDFIDEMLRQKKESLKKLVNSIPSKVAEICK